MVELAINIIALTILCLTCYDLKWGLLTMLVCYFLLPEIPFSFLGGALKKNHLMMFVVIIFYIRYFFYENNFLDTSPYRFCILYFLLSLLFIPWKTDTSYSIQLYYLIYDVAIILLFPIALWNLVCKEHCISLFRNALLSCISIACVYGLMLIFTEGFNPLIIFFSAFGGGLDEESWIQYFSDEGRLFGRISSVFFHPMHYASFLGFSALYVFYVRDKIPKWIFYSLSIIILINFVTCGVRSVLGAMMATLFVFVIMKRDQQLTLQVAAMLIVGLVILLLIPPAFDYISTIFSKSESDLGGSSIEMRLNQLAGAFDEIQENILLGKGYGWSRDYIIQNENHPVLLGFESILFVTICNNGILGLLFYCLFFYMYVLYINTYLKEEDKAFYISLLTFYFVYECITGEFAFQQFMLFYTFVLFESLEFEIVSGYYNNESNEYKEIGQTENSK